MRNFHMIDNQVQKLLSKAAADDRRFANHIDNVYICPHCCPYYIAFIPLNVYLSCPQYLPLMSSIPTSRVLTHYTPPHIEGTPQKEEPQGAENQQGTRSRFRHIILFE